MERALYCHGCRNWSSSPAPERDESPTCPSCGSDFVEWRSSAERPQILPGGTTGAPDTVQTVMQQLLNALQDAGTQVFVHGPAGGGMGLGDIGTGNMEELLNQLMEQHQPVFQPTQQSIRQNLPRRKVPASADVKGDEEYAVGANCKAGDPCSICHTEFEADEEVTQLPCEHCYHHDCILPWLETHNTCPICRAPLPGEAGPRAQPAPGAANPGGNAPGLDGANANPMAEDLLGLTGGVLGGLQMPQGPGPQNPGGGMPGGTVHRVAIPVPGDLGLGRGLAGFPSLLGQMLHPPDLHEFFGGESDPESDPTTASEYTEDEADMGMSSGHSMYDDDDIDEDSENEDEDYMSDSFIQDPETRGPTANPQEPSLPAQPLHNQNRGSRTGQAPNEVDSALDTAGDNPGNSQVSEKDKTDAVQPGSDAVRQSPDHQTDSEPKGSDSTGETTPASPARASNSGMVRSGSAAENLYQEPQGGRRGGLQAAFGPVGWVVRGTMHHVGNILGRNRQ